MNTSAWTRDRSSSAEPRAAPFSRIRFAARVESAISDSSGTVPRRPRDDGPPLLGAAPDELRVLPRPEREPLRRQVDGLEEVRLAGAVRAGDEHEPGLERELEAFVRADVAE